MSTTTRPRYTSRYRRTLSAQAALVAQVTLATDLVADDGNDEEVATRPRYISSYRLQESQESWDDLMATEAVRESWGDLLAADGSMTFSAVAEADIDAAIQGLAEKFPQEPLRKKAFSSSVELLPLPVQVLFDPQSVRGGDKVQWTLVLIQTKSGRIRCILTPGAGLGSDLVLRIGARRYPAVSSLGTEPGWIYQTVFTAAASRHLYCEVMPPAAWSRLPFKAFLAESARDWLSRPVPAALDYAALIFERNHGMYLAAKRCSEIVFFQRALSTISKVAQRETKNLLHPDPVLTVKKGVRVIRTISEFPLMIDVIAASPIVDGKLPKNEKVDRKENQDLLNKLAMGLYSPLVASPPVDVLAPLYLQFPNFSGALDIVADALSLAARAPGPGAQPLCLHPILLSGPPGIGKSAFCIALSAALGYGETPPLEIDFAVTSAAFVLSGLAPSWSGSRQGLILDALMGSPGEPQPPANLMIVGNEVDKVATQGLNQPSALMPLLTLLEPGTAIRFHDEFVDKIAINASKIVWILTANDASHLPEPLLSRVEVVDIAMPTPGGMRGIAERMYAGTRAREAWGESFPEELSGEVLDRLAQSASPREMKRAISRALGAAARAGAAGVGVENLADVTVQRRGIGF